MRHDALFKKVRDLSPSRIELYLETHGWVHDGFINEVATIWHRTEEEYFDYEILLPSSASLKDYDARLVDAIRSLAKFERCSESEVLERLHNFYSDLISIRVVHADVEAGTIPLIDGVELNQKARDLMTSAIMTTLRKGRHFSGRRPPEVKEYLHSLRLGQTQVGSYVVNIIVPIVATDEAQQSSDHTPLARMVTANLMAGLQALEAAIASYGNTRDLTVFDEAVLSGASANLCDALIGMSGLNRNRSFYVAVKPSPHEALDSEAKNFCFDSSAVEFIKQASEYYKDNYTLLNRKVIGLVKTLHQVPGEEGGKISVATTLGGVEKSVNIDLSPKEYVEAIHAHEKKEAVECCGDIYVSPRSARLVNPSGFRVLNNNDLF